MQPSVVVRTCLGLLTLALFVAGVTASAASRPVRGALQSAEILQTLSRASIDSRNRNIGLSGPALCDVKVVQLMYQSIGVRKEPATLSAGLFVPENCSGPFPLLAEGHGTQTDTPYVSTLVSPADSKIVFFAARGYLVVTSDYLGLGKSSYPYHPYLHADSEASAIIDSIRAAQAATRTLAIPMSDQVMLFGYSQGGHATMAAQREIERRYRSEIHLVASAHMAGPYSVSQTFMDTWFGYTAGEENAFSPELFAYTLVNYQNVYGNLYRTLDEVIAQPYVDIVKTLYPTTQSLYEIRERNVLPPGRNLDQLRTPSFTAAFLLDERQPFRRALKQNDLLDWTPATPMILCGSRRDAIVEFSNAYAAQAAFRARGVNVPLIDVADEIPAGTNGAAHHIQYGGALCYAKIRAQLLDPVRTAGASGNTAASPATASAKEH